MYVTPKQKIAMIMTTRTLTTDLSHSEHVVIKGKGTGATNYTNEGYVPVRCGSESLAFLRYLGNVLC